MKRFFLIAAAVLLLVVGLLYLTGFIGSSSARLAKDHSISLPSSVSHIRCGGLFSLRFTDSDADASFEIASKDLPAVLSQFSWQPGTGGDHINSLNERMPVPAEFLKPSALQRGVSHNNNVVFLQSYDLGGSRVGICIYTMIN